MRTALTAPIMMKRLKSEPREEGVSFRIFVKTRTGFKKDLVDVLVTFSLPKETSRCEFTTSYGAVSAVEVRTA